MIVGGENLLKVEVVRECLRIMGPKGHRLITGRMFVKTTREEAVKEEGGGGDGGEEEEEDLWNEKLIHDMADEIFRSFSDGFNGGDGDEVGVDEKAFLDVAVRCCEDALSSGYSAMDELFETKEGGGESRPRWRTTNRHSSTCTRHRSPSRAPSQRNTLRTRRRGRRTRGTRSSRQSRRR